MNADAMNKNVLDSPLISAYLNSLERALNHAEDRDEVVASVREHIVEALNLRPEPQDPEAVREVLAELGPVERIANLSETTTPMAAQENPRSWGAVVAAIVAFLSLAFVFVVPFVAVPLAVGSLVAGILLLRNTRSRRGVLEWLATILSATTLLIAIFGALFFLPLGDADPGTSTPVESLVPPPGE